VRRGFVPSALGEGPQVHDPAERFGAPRGPQRPARARRIVEAVPGAEVTVIRLRAPLAVLQARIRSREAGDQGWFLEAAAHTAEVLERAGVEDHLVDYGDRSALEVAQEVLRLVGWPGAGA
jgi:hypothetical protein